MKAEPKEMKKPNILDYEYSDRSIYRRDLDKYVDYIYFQNKELIKVIKECDDYLKGNKLNYIGNGSILHTKMKKSLKTNKK